MRETDRPSVFVVRSGAGWFLMGVGGLARRSVSVADVVAELSSGVVGLVRSGPVVGRGVVGVGPGDVVGPVWCLVGRVDGPFVVVEDLWGGDLLLDETDLVILDALVEPTRVEDLECGVGIDELCDRLGRLAGAGRLRVHETSSVGSDPDPAVTVEEAVAQGAVAGAGNGHGAGWLTGVSERVRTAWRLSSRLAPLRERIEERFAPPQPVTDPAEAAGPETSNLGEPGSDTTEEFTDTWQPDEGPEGRIPVYAIWHTHVGPLLSLGMLTASARHFQGGALCERYEIRRPETAESFLDDLARRNGPAVLLCSDYVWSVTENLHIAREALKINPNLVVIHGGPSCPKYEGDAEDFLDAHGEVAHILTRGEGEHLICELLDTLTPTPTSGLADPTNPNPTHIEGLEEINGITYRTPTGETIRTPERERISNLDDLPSPYLTGEFDHIHPSAWNYCMSVETNRGCPYGCTFCDWGSSTLSRIRKFDLERVTQEIQWAANRHITSLNIPDANFGIMSRDTETAKRIAHIKNQTGYPELISFYPAKNTTKHLTRIMDTLLDAGVVPAATLSLQTTDPATLSAIDRSNISTDHYVALAAEYRRHGHPLQGDLLIGLPGQTYDTYRNDLQFMLDHEILVRTWPVQVLPNSPMNDPDYRKRHRIRANDQNAVISTASFDESERDRMFLLRRLYVCMEDLGVLRHVMRWLQWDHNIPATQLMDHILTTTQNTPNRFPHLTWLTEYFDLHPTAPVGWNTLYNEIRDLITQDHHITDTTTLDTILTLQQFLMPTPGRTFPTTITLTHDYPTYYHDATQTLYTTGHATNPPKPLNQYPPTTFTITDDPLDLCNNGTHFAGNSRDELMEGDFQIGANSSHELLSELTRPSPFLASQGVEPAARDVPVGNSDQADVDGSAANAGAGSVTLRIR